MFAITSMMLIGFLMKTSFLGQDQKRRMHSMVNHTTHVVSMIKRMSFSVCTHSSSSYSMNVLFSEYTSLKVWNKGSVPSINEAVATMTVAMNKMVKS